MMPRMSPSAPESPQVTPSWGATLRVYREPATLRIGEGLRLGRRFFARVLAVKLLLLAVGLAAVGVMAGPAVGAGCELALTCDFRVGGPKAVFCMPPAKVGVVYALKGLASG